MSGSATRLPRCTGSAGTCDTSAPIRAAMACRAPCPPDAPMPTSATPAHGWRGSGRPAPPDRRLDLPIEWPTPDRRPHLPLEWYAAGVTRLEVQAGVLVVALGRDGVQISLA